MSRLSNRRATPLILLLGLAVGCAGKEFRAYDGPPDPATDVRLTIDDERVRIVSADGVAVPKDFGEAKGDRTLWIRGERAANARLTLGIAPHASVIKDDVRLRPSGHSPVPISPGAAHVHMTEQGYRAAVDYPGSSRNQRITFAARPAGHYVVALDGKLDANKKPVWGFTVTEAGTEVKVPVGPPAWEPNADGGVEATPWNLWDLPDDAIEMRSTIYN